MLSNDVTASLGLVWSGRRPTAYTRAPHAERAHTNVVLTCELLWPNSVNGDGIRREACLFLWHSVQRYNFIKVITLPVTRDIKRPAPRQTAQRNDAIPKILCAQLWLRATRVAFARACVATDHTSEAGKHVRRMSWLGTCFARDTSLLETLERGRTHSRPATVAVAVAFSRPRGKCRGFVALRKQSW